MTTKRRLYATAYRTRKGWSSVRFVHLAQDEADDLTRRYTHARGLRNFFLVRMEDGNTLEAPDYGLLLSRELGPQEAR